MAWRDTIETMQSRSTRCPVNALVSFIWALGRERGGVTYSSISRSWSIIHLLAILAKIPITKDASGVHDLSGSIRGEDLKYHHIVDTDVPMKDSS